MKTTKFTVWFLLLTVLFLTTGCNDGYDDSELIGRVENLENRVQKLEEQMNSNISSLQAILEALNNNDYITKVVPITDGVKEIGYTIHFSKGNSINIYHGQNGQNGQDGYTPQIGVKQGTDGIYYWTLDGEWMTDDSGNKIKAQGVDGLNGEDGQNGKPGEDGQNGQDGQDGITPQLKIENDYWWVSYDNGANWTKLGKATGEDAKNMFQHVTVKDSEVEFILSDGTTFVLPINRKIEIIFDYNGGEIGITEGKTIYINYTLKNASENVLVTASSDGNFVTKVESDGNTGGRISVKFVNGGTDGYINVMVNDGNGYSFIKVINIYKNRIIFPEGLDYKINATGGYVVVPFSVNFDYDIAIVEGNSWISIKPKSKAKMRDEILILAVSQNTTSTERYAKVNIFNPADSEEVYAEIIIGQSGISGDDTNTMIFVTRANFSNDFTAYLPLYGTLDCRIDWGDGEVNYYEGSYSTNDITHKYQVTEPTSFDVKITGKVSQLNSSGLITHTITDVKQWGRLGLTSMYKAFYGNSILKSIPNDTLGAFENVSDFGYAFHLCVSLTTIPEGLFDNCTNVTSFASTFSGNLLTTIPEGLFDNCTNVINFESTFSDNALTFIPEGLFDNCTNVTSFASTFSGNLLTTIPEGLFDYCTNVTSFKSTFTGNKFVTIPEGLFDNCTNVTSFSYTFSSCDNLTSIPIGLFDYNRKVTNFGSTFAYCGKVDGESPYTIIDGVKYHLYDRYKNVDHFVTPSITDYCFSSGFDDYKDIPSSWK